MRAIQIASFGNPADVLRLIDLPEPPQPGAGEALIGVEYAPINHNDLFSSKERSTTRPPSRLLSAMRALAASWPSVRAFQM
jgi:NADPH:quinone reductase-like Zn-dependent oxidoreductase